MRKRLNGHSYQMMNEKIIGEKVRYIIKKRN